MSQLRNALLNAVAGRGFELRRHPAARRQRMFVAHGVDLVLDVGAADGGYGRTLRRFGYEGRIVSFEPLAAAYGRLSESIVGDPRWTARHHALGDSSGTAEINVASNSDSSSLLPMNESHRAASPEVGYLGTETIRIETLDAIAPEVLGAAAHPFLKIDTQGFEKQVLAGAQGTLDRITGVQLELSFVSLYEGGMLIDEAITMMYDAGFRLAVIEQGWASPTGAMLQSDGIFFRD